MHEPSNEMQTDFLVECCFDNYKILNYSLSSYVIKTNCQHSNRMCHFPAFGINIELSTMVVHK